MRSVYFYLVTKGAANKGRLRHLGMFLFSRIQRALSEPADSLPTISVKGNHPFSPNTDADVTNTCTGEEGLGQSATNVNPVGTEERRTDGGTNCVAWRAHHVPRSISFTTPRQLYCLFPPPFPRCARDCATDEKSRLDTCPPSLADS